MSYCCIALKLCVHGEKIDRKLCWLQTAEGEYEAILPDTDLRAMYQRIVAREITVAGGSSTEAPPAEGANAAGAGKARRSISSTMAQTVRLASVMGFPQLALPFRSAFDVHQAARHRSWAFHSSHSPLVQPSRSMKLPSIRLKQAAWLA